MVCGRILLCVVLVAAWNEVSSARLHPLLVARLRSNVEHEDNVVIAESEVHSPGEVVRARVREGAPPPLCAGRCASPPAGPVCAFDAAGTARTFATLCELEAVSCRESTYYAITSLGEC